MKEIDEIISLYDHLVKFIATNLFNDFLGLINRKDNNLVIEEEKQAVFDDEWISDYPNLYGFLDKEASYYVQNKQSLYVSGKYLEELISIVEKAIFYNDFIFHNHFEITHVWSTPIEKDRIHSTNYR